MEMTTKLKKMPLYHGRKMKSRVNTHLRHISQCGYLYKYILPRITFYIFL